MKTNFANQSSFMNQNKSHFSFRDSTIFDQNQQNLKSAYEILNSQHSQQVQIQSLLPCSKVDQEMAELKDMGIISTHNDFEDNQDSCPFARIEIFKKQNFNKTTPLPYQAGNDFRKYGLENTDQHNLLMQDDNMDTSQGDMTFSKEGGFKDQIQHNLVTPIKPHNLQYSFSSQTLVQQRYQMDIEMDLNIGSVEFDKEQKSSTHNNQMAPNFIQKLLQSRSYQQSDYQHIHQAHSFQQPLNHMIDRSNRVTVGNYSDRGNNSFITPIKSQAFNPISIKMNAFTEAKSKNQNHNVSIRDLSGIKTSILPVHIINQKKGKSKILNFDKIKARNIPKSSKQSDDHIEQAHAPCFQHQQQFNDKIMMEENVDINRRVNKQKSKKKAFNKTVPTVAYKEAFEEALNSLKPTLSVQAYEIGYLNSLDDFNQKINDDNKQSLSLQGNYDQFQANLLNYNRLSLNDQDSKNIHQTVKNITNLESERFEQSLQLNDNSSHKIAQLNHVQCQNSDMVNKSEQGKAQWLTKSLNQKQVTFEEKITTEQTSQETKKRALSKVSKKEVQSGNNSQITKFDDFTNQNNVTALQQEQDFIPMLKQLMYPPISYQQQQQQFPFSQVDKRVKCNCQKNSCTQGYCDCLKNGQACDPFFCSCQSCQNTIENQNLRLEVQDKKQKQGLVKDGCNCKFSQCQKRYCECFQRGAQCDPVKCKCQDCKNNVPHVHNTLEQNSSIPQQLFKSKVFNE